LSTRCCWVPERYVLWGADLRPPRSGVSRLAAQPAPGTFRCPLSEDRSARRPPGSVGSCSLARHPPRRRARRPPSNLNSLPDARVLWPIRPSAARARDLCPVIGIIRDVRSRW